MNTTSLSSAATGWNWPHLLLLLALPGYAWLTQTLAWPPQVTLAFGTLGGLAWLIACERWRPWRLAWQPSRHEIGRDLASLAVNAAVDAGATALLALLALRWAAEPGLMTGVPLVLQLPLAIALGELGPYCLHRLAHRRPLLWRFHALHHWPQALNASNSVLVHPLNMLWNKVTRLLPWLVLGFSAEAMLWAALFIQVQSMAVHANLPGRIGPLNWVLGSAEQHRWHHSVKAAEAHNYGTAIPLWDQLFRSWVYRPLQAPARVGWLESAERPARVPWLGCCDVGRGARPT